MKKTTVLTVLVAMVAGFASAAPIYSEDFSSVTMKDDPVIDGGLIYYPGDFGVGEFGTLKSNTTALVNSSEQLVIKSNSNGGSRGVATAISGADFTGAGIYTLSFDYVNAWNFATLDVQIFDVKDAAVGNAVYADVVTGPETASTLDKWAASTATITDLTGVQQYPNGVLEGTTQSLNFAYDGLGGDIILLFTAESSAGNQQVVIIDNLSVIPEPATLGLVSILGAGIVYLRRRVFFE